MRPKPATQYDGNAADPFGLLARQVLGIGKHYSQRWDKKRRKAPLPGLSVDEIHFGMKSQVSHGGEQSGEPLWFGKYRKEEILDQYFRKRLTKQQRERIEAACVDMWEPFTKSILKWSPQCNIVYDKCHVMRHATIGGRSAKFALWRLPLEPAAGGLVKALTYTYSLTRAASRLA